MPFIFIAAIVFAVIATIATVVWRSYAHRHPKDDKERSVESYKAKDDLGALRAITVALWVLTVVLLIFSSTTMISTKNVGVATEFGRPTGTLSNGIHIKKPWAMVTEFDAAIQTDSHVGKDATPCTDIRIGNQSTACIDNSIRWRIRQSEADTLYQDYRDFEKVRDSLVTRELNAALNEVFATYNPLNVVETVPVKTDANLPAAKSELDEMGKKVTERLQNRIGSQIEVINVILPLVRFDGPTQEKINQYQAEIANTRIATQRVKTATEEALANGKLSGSVSKDPNVLVSKCFDTLNSMVREKQSIPAGFSCWPGGQSAVVVPSANK